MYSVVIVLRAPIDNIQPFASEGAALSDINLVIFLFIPVLFTTKYD